MSFFCIHFLVEVDCVTAIQFHAEPGSHPHEAL